MRRATKHAVLGYLCRGLIDCTLSRREDLGICSLRKMTHQTIDLWTPMCPTGRLHPHFQALTQMPENQRCITRWTHGFKDVNNTIVHEFQTKFSPAFWELYLHAMFTSLGFSVARPALRPDFVLDTPHGGIVAEAKVTEAGPGGAPEWAPKHEAPFNRDEFYARTSMKLAGALAAKLKSFLEYELEPHVKDCPFLLCLSPFDHPWFVLQGFGAITRVLYQYGDPIVGVDGTGAMVEIGHQRVASVTKPNGTEIPLGLFLDREYASISAVFFNPRATLSKVFADPLRASHKDDRIKATWYLPSTGELRTCQVHPSDHHETLADGGYLLLNSHSRHPINPDAFFEQGVTVCSFDENDRVLTSRTPEPFLKDRTATGVIPDS